MEKFLYFAGINGGAGGADASADAGMFPVSRFCGVVPLSVTTTAINFTSTLCDAAPHAGGGPDQIVVTHADTSTTTGHRCKLIAQAVARACNAHPNTNGIVDVCDVDNDIYFDGFSDIKDDSGFDIVIGLDS
jgi:hypothetical protein